MNIANQTLIFLNACILGFCLGAVYDLFRITRIAFKSCSVIIFIEDLAFFLIATISSFIFIVMNNEGVFRAVLVIGEILGATLYFCTLSVVIIKAAHLIINTIKAVFKLIYKITINPIVKCLVFIFKKIKHIAGKIIEKRAKLKQNEISLSQAENITVDEYFEE